MRNELLRRVRRRGAIKKRDLKTLKNLEILGSAH